MSGDLGEEVKKLREEIANLKQQLEDVAERERKRSHGIYIDVNSRVRDDIEDVMESVAEGIHGELEKSIFIGPRGIRIIRGHEPIKGESEEASPAKAAKVMSALGHEHRLKILKELVSGGKYINELQDKLSEITTSTLSSHLSVLEGAGLVVQEKVRGRYLITMPGRTAYKMAIRITKILERGDEE